MLFLFAHAFLVVVVVVVLLLLLLLLLLLFWEMKLASCFDWRTLFPANRSNSSWGTKSHVARGLGGGGLSCLVVAADARAPVVGRVGGRGRSSRQIH